MVIAFISVSKFNYIDIGVVVQHCCWCLGSIHQFTYTYMIVVNSTSSPVTSKVVNNFVRANNVGLVPQSFN